MDLKLVIWIRLTALEAEFLYPQNQKSSNSGSAIFPVDFYSPVEYCMVGIYPKIWIKGAENLLFLFI